MDIKKEALRYMGFRGNPPDEATETLLERAYDELTALLIPKYCYKVVSAETAEPILLGSDIRRHIVGCGEVILFAATLGAAADKLIRTAEIENMAYAVVLDTLASAYIEDFCDRCCEEISVKVSGNMTARFSPGYGDYPIGIQKDFIRFINADKLIGLTATENHILIPRKSVTAVIGVSENEIKHSVGGCENCSMRESCAYRKENKSCDRR